MADGKILVAGGLSVQGVAAIASTEIFDPLNETFTPAAPMTVGRRGHTAIALPDGRVLSAGGATTNSGLSSAEVYGVQQGAGCKADSECLTGHCSDGVCCDKACDGPCDVCTKALGADADGTCKLPLPFGGVPSCAPFVCDGVNAACPTSCASDSDCVAGEYCTAAHVCGPRHQQGESCSPDDCADKNDCMQCTTGHCVDGVCCDKPCTGQCEACNVGDPGICSPVIGAPVEPRPDCADGGDPSCGAKCDGINRNACIPSGGALCSADCVDGKLSVSLCSADNTCDPAFQVPCAPYQCSGTGGCKFSCESDADCQENYSCVKKACVPASNRCLDDQTFKDADGKEVPCEPYLCRGNACLVSCQSVHDCQRGYVCDNGTKTCVRTESVLGSGNQAGGCACDLAGAPRSPRAFAPLALAALAALRRRRRQRR
jgi:MYXO-CTERM domain-containing protein